MNYTFNEGDNVTITAEFIDYLENLKKENQQLKEVLDEIRKYIESKNNGVCIINGEEKPAYTFLLDFDKAREFVWELLQILDKAKNNDS